jgi:hypothetical protein
MAGDFFQKEKNAQPPEHGEEHHRESDRLCIGARFASV